MTTLLLILSAAAVIFMVFGLAFFYAGQTNERSVTNTLLMSFGSLAIGFLGTEVGLFYGNGLHQLGIQSIAVISTIIYSGLITLMLAIGLKNLIGIRVGATVEQEGIDQTHMV